MSDDLQWSDERAMRLAMEEARQGFGFVSPNPPVGCVILDKNGKLISKGFHARVGGDHAEIDALKKVGDLERLQGATLFVTLEPCAHQGRTPSCAKHLATLPLGRVVYGLADPNPLVNGQGAAVLQAAGIKTEKFESLQNELLELVEIFIWNMKQKQAWVTLKVASSLDGKTALPSGESQWITGEGARRRVQALRGHYDAVMVGSRTVLRDNPSLNIRDERFSAKTNKVVVIDPIGETLPALEKSNILKYRPPENVLVALLGGNREKEKSYAKLGCRVILPRLQGSRFDLRDLSGRLFQNEVYSVLCEGGAALFSSYLGQQAANRVIVFQNLSILGRGDSWSEDLEIASLSQRLHLLNPSVENLGEDILVTGRLRDLNQ